MRDAIELEWAGIPSVSIIGEPLIGGVEQMKKLTGMVDYEYAILPSPYPSPGEWTPEEGRGMARQLLPRIVELLTRNGR